MKHIYQESKVFTERQKGQKNHKTVLNSKTDLKCWFKKKIFLSEKNKEITSLKDKLEDLEASSRKTDSNAETKPDETQQELKKAKRTAFVARANLIKKNLELDHLKNELESAKGQYFRNELEW